MVVVAEPDAVVVLVATMVMTGDVGVWGCCCCCFRGRERGGNAMVIVEASFLPVVVVETGMLRPFDTTLNPLLRAPVS